MSTTNGSATAEVRALPVKHRQTAQLVAHPAPDVFPMLRDDELSDLAADIVERGLLQPIVLDSQNRILDGRNRYAACQLAGVEPAFTTYDGDDPDGYVLAANIARRHMTKGQQAMVVARVLLASNNTGQTEAARQHGISQASISQATTVIKHAPECVTSVISGAIPLDSAYNEAKERKRKAEEAEQLLAQLRKDAPEFADQVVEGKLNALEAYRAWKNHEAQRKQRDQHRRETATSLICDNVFIIAQWNVPRAVHLAQNFDPAEAKARAVTLQTLLDAQAAVEAMIGVWKERGLQ